MIIMAILGFVAIVAIILSAFIFRDPPAPKTEVVFAGDLADECISYLNEFMENVEEDLDDVGHVAEIIYYALSQWVQEKYDEPVEHDEEDN